MPSEDEEHWSWVEMPLSELEAVPGAILDDEFPPARFPDAVPFLYAEFGAVMACGEHDLEASRELALEQWTLMYSVHPKYLIQAAKPRVPS